MNQTFRHMEIEIAHISTIEINEIKPELDLTDEALETFAGKYRVITTDLNQGLDEEYLIDETTGKIMLFDSHLQVLNHYGKQGWQVVSLEKYSSSTDLINNYIKIILQSTL